MVVKTYRGLLADDGQEKIALATRDGSVGYRIIKFQIIPNKPGTTAGEHTMKIWKNEQPTVTAPIDFTDSDLLAVSYMENGSSSGNMQPEVIIFDNEIFNQDIYITQMDESGTEPCNYYLELEQMKLDQTQNMSATLKAIRGVAVD